MNNASLQVIDHAALSGPFSPARFLYGIDDRLAVLSALGPMCHEVVENDQILWRMHNSDRLRALKSLVGEPARLNRRLRKRAPMRDDIFAQVLAECLKGTHALKIESFVPKGDPDTLGKLRDAISAVKAAQSVVGTKRLIALRKFDDDLHRATINHSEQARQKIVLPNKLCGRVAERREVLNFLRDRSIGPPLNRLDPSKPTLPRSLLIMGSPGMGKSAFLADLSQRIEKLSPKPWVVRLDFDIMTLLHGDMIAWSEEATRQLGHQIPSVGKKLSQLRRDLANSRVGSTREATLSEAEFLLEDSAEVLAQVPHKPLIILLDTIEEVVSRNMRELFETSPEATRFQVLVDWVSRLSQLNGAQPVHTIYSGRIAPPVTADRLADWFDLQLELPELEDPHAVELLGLLEPGLGQEARASLVKGLGGHPLHLIIVLKHLRSLDSKERAATIKELEDSGLGGMASKEVMQTLYSRFLDRLRIIDPGSELTSDIIKTLAHPGMLLREVTVESLSKIIAPAVDLKLSEDALKDAFRILRDQVWLVNSQPGSDVITHRADVRRVMLPMMIKDPKPEIESVLNAAIADCQAKDDAVGAGYYRALLGQTDWLDNDHSLAQPVVNRAGQDELQLLDIKIRARLKYYAPQAGELDEDERKSLPEHLRDDLIIRSDAKMVRKTGSRRPSRANQSLNTDTSVYGRLIQELQEVGSSGDAHAILNHPNLQREISTAFSEANYDAVFHLGLAAIEAIEIWPNLGRPFRRNVNFDRHWLWLLTLAAATVTIGTSLGQKLLNNRANSLHELISNHFLESTKSQGSFDSTWNDIDMLRHMLNPRPVRKIDNQQANSNLNLRPNVNAAFRGQRALVQSPIVRQASIGSSISLGVSANTISFLASEFEMLGTDNNIQKKVRFDTSSSKARSIKLVHDILEYWHRPNDKGANRIYREFVRTQRNEGAPLVPLTFIPISGERLPTKLLNRIARGQTPELHETIAGLLANEVGPEAIRNVAKVLEKKTPFWRPELAKNVEYLSANMNTPAERWNAAFEITRFADLCGQLNLLVEQMSGFSNAPRIEKTLTLLRRLDEKWTWPT